MSLRRAAANPLYTSQLTAIHGATPWLCQLPPTPSRRIVNTVDLRTIRQKIIDSSRGDWHQIARASADSGPVYHYGFTSWRTQHDSVETEAQGHGSVAVLIDDVDISIAWGYDPDERVRVGRERGLDSISYPDT